MELVSVFFVLIVGGVIGGGTVWDWHRSHRSDREKVLEAELDALRAAQRLSIASWRARQRMKTEAQWADPIETDDTGGF